MNKLFCGCFIESRSGILIQCQRHESLSRQQANIDAGIYDDERHPDAPEGNSEYETEDNNE